jgi:hypothetical protein
VTETRKKKRHHGARMIEGCHTLLTRKRKKRKTSRCKNDKEMSYVVNKKIKSW